MKLWVTILVFLGVTLNVSATPTTISYQGQLQDASGPFSGQAEMQFQLYDSTTGGQAVGPALTLSDVEVIEGLFSVDLDFGAVFDGSVLYLGVEVDGQTLTPRQRIAAAPMAQFALTPAGPEGPEGPQGPAGPTGPEGPEGASPFELSGDDAFYSQGSVAIGTGIIPPGSPRLYVLDNQNVGMRINSQDSEPLLLDRRGPDGQDGSVIPMLTLSRRSNTAPEPGMGASIDFRMEASNGAFGVRGQIETLYDDPEISQTTTDMVFRTRGVESSLPRERLRLTHDNKVEVAGELAFFDGTPQRTAGPIAKGFINSNGSIENSVNIESVEWEAGVNRYRVTLTGENYWFNRYLATVTPTGSSPIAVSTSSQGGDLIVMFADGAQQNFQLVVHDLPDGTVTQETLADSSGLEITAPRGPGIDHDDDSTAASPALSASRALAAVRTENQALRKEVADLETRLEILEHMLIGSEQIAGND